MSLNLTFPNYNRIKNSDVPFLMILRFLPYKKQSKTSFKIPPKHWDKEQQVIKRRYRSLHPELNKRLSMLHEKYQEAFRLVESGDLRPNDVCSFVLNHELIKRVKKEISIYEYIKLNKGDYGERAIQKHLANVRGVEKHLTKCGTRLGELKLSMLKVKHIRDEIVLALRKAGLKITTQNAYLSTLDLVSFKAGHGKPFKENNLKQRGNDSQKRKGLENADILFDAMRNIKSYKDIEAYLMFLYSYCLQGLDSTDIANISEKSIVDYNNEPISHFYQFGEFIESDSNKTLSKKWYLGGLRGKSNESIDCLINLFPILYIRDWMHYLVSITQPERAYRGKDRLRLYSFTTKIYSNKQDPEGTKKMKIHADVLSKKMKKNFGVSLQMVRHTYTQIGKRRLGLTEGQMDYQLNHSLSTAAQTYQAAENAKEIRDVRHYQIIKFMEVEKVLKELKRVSMMLYRQGKLLFYKRTKATPTVFEYDKRGVRKVKLKSSFPPPYKIVSNDMLIGELLFEHQASSSWTHSKEERYQQMLMELKLNPQREIDKDGFPTKKILQEDEYPIEFKKLREEKKKAFGEFNHKISKMGAVDLSKDFLSKIVRQEKSIEYVKSLLDF